MPVQSISLACQTKPSASCCRSCVERAGQPLAATVMCMHATSIDLSMQSVQPLSFDPDLPCLIALRRRPWPLYLSCTSATGSFHLYECKCNSGALGNMHVWLLCVPHHIWERETLVRLHIAPFCVCVCVCFCHEALVLLALHASMPGRPAWSCIDALRR